jgi:hypothetical protein
LVWTPLLIGCLWVNGQAQEPIGALEGQITDASNSAVSGAAVTARNAQTGLARKVLSSARGSFHISNLPAGEYAIEVTANGFAPFSVNSVRVNIGQAVLYNVRLEGASAHSEVSVTGQTVMVDTSQIIGDTVASREAADLPLNGRDLTQLGLLQPGVAPLTLVIVRLRPLAIDGECLTAARNPADFRQDRPLDGATNVDSVNGGYALRVPVEAVSEFRILTLNAPAEYGNTSGATTSMVTKSGRTRFTAMCSSF